MPNAPVADQLRLLDVQALDTKLAQLKHQHAHAPQRARVDEVTEQINDLSSALIASRTAASDLTRELKKAEDDVEQVATRLQRDQTRLDTGNVGVKDAQALVAEVASLTKRKADLEEIQLDVMERLDAHNDALAKVEEANNSMQSALDDANAQLRDALEQINQQARDIAAQRTQAAQGLDSGLLALYDKLRNQLGGVGAAALVGNRCGGCRLELNPTDLADIRSASAEKIVRCEECSRILVRVPEPVSALAAE
ncbi:zinc ribbon domain-containing protein [Timonella sp. A28]|uniref:zinc ribbon domain-containing protein n=1 Tax=Timonella sp. A28 TaxID=3442640 RepID=UPI003EB724CF